MNEIFWLSIALIVILFFAYKPLKRALKNTIDGVIRGVIAFQDVQIISPKKKSFK